MDNLSIKAMALSSRGSLKSLLQSLNDQGVDLVCTPGIGEAVSCVQGERFDIILVDSLLDGAANTCRSMFETGVAPVALLVRDKEADWQSLCSWDVDGFVAEDSGKTEIVARIKAIARRSAG